MLAELLLPIQLCNSNTTGKIMKHNFKQQIPYILALSMLIALNLHASGYHFAWSNLLWIAPLSMLGLWYYRRSIYIIPGSKFSMMKVFRKYRHVAVIITAGSCCMYYWAYHCISISNIALTLTTMAMSCVIFERSIYD